MKIPIHEAQKAWDTSRRRGQMGWLKDTTFISVDCFQPLDTAPPRSWKRIAVPPATGRHGDQKIFKRVVASPYMDTKYLTVASELDSQGFGGRKRAKTEKYLEAWSWGGSRFDPAHEEESTGGYDLARARLQVKRAYKNIKEDNQDIVSRLAHSKRPTFPPVQLSWIPRKRHNTRWPVTPPEEDAPLLAELQPLIKFEIHPGQIDDPAFWEQQDPMDSSESEPTQLGAEHAQKLSSRRLSTAKRPSLSTISEELKETNGFPFTTPDKSHRSVYGSPLKRWSVITDRYTTPTKVASSPLGNFTLIVTPSKVVVDEFNEIDGTNEAEVAQLSPINPATEGNKELSTMENDTSTPLSSPCFTAAATDKKAGPVEKTDSQQDILQSPSTPLSSRSTTPAARSVAVFDQPAPKMPFEPEHETRRRISLDNARRSDRRSDAKFNKRVRVWNIITNSIKRRHSIPTTNQKKPREENRRHTLDVDAGRNPDIFGQATQATKQKAFYFKPKITLDMAYDSDLGFVSKDTAHQEKVQGEPGHEQLMPEALGSSATSPDENAQHATTPSSVRNYTYNDCDMLKPINEIYNQSPTRDSPVSDRNSSTTDEPTIDATAVDSTKATEPTIESPTSHTHVDAYDDSELSLLRNFVRRAQMKPKRRSSVTLCNGSPVAKADVADISIESPRVPLSEKNANKSPSPSKKRRVKDAEDVPLTATTKASRLVTPDLEDTTPQPQRKKRRRGSEMDSPSDVLNPDIKFSQRFTQKGASGGLRRSKRVATTKPTEPAVPSQIPVRLPGFSGMMTDADMPTVSTAGLVQRKTEKDLATLTRTNTRRNKGGAVPVPARLADMLDVANAGTPDPFCSPTNPTTTISGVKAVRWDDVLFRTQGEDGELVATVMEEEKVDEQDEEEDDDDAEEELQPPQMRTELGRPSKPVGKKLVKHEEKLVAAPASSPAPPQSEPDKKKKALRPRASRLPAAKKSSGLPGATPKRKAAAAASSLQAPPLISKTAATRSTAGATPTTSKRVGVLGVSLGTPAPKRRGANKR